MHNINRQVESQKVRNCQSKLTTKLAEACLWPVNCAKLYAQCQLEASTWPVPVVLNSRDEVARSQQGSEHDLQRRSHDTVILNLLDHLLDA